jgi:microcompartment protein CcmL/EutN
VVAVSLTRPEGDCRNYISFPVNRERSVESGALGLIETRGYAVQTRIADAMVKAANVRVVNVLTVANRVVCSLFQGEVGAVTEAMGVGRAMLADYPYFLCSAILPQPVSAVYQAFGRRPSSGGGSG